MVEVHLRAHAMHMTGDKVNWLNLQETEGEKGNVSRHYHTSRATERNVKQGVNAGTKILQFMEKIRARLFNHIQKMN